MSLCPAQESAEAAVRKKQLHQREVIPERMENDAEVEAEEEDAGAEKERGMLNEGS
jgi:hypothetical protein